MAFEAEQELSFEEAVRFLPEGDMVHTTVQAGLVILGADYERGLLLREMEKAETIRVSGVHAQSAGHGLAIPYPKDKSHWMFIATTHNLLEGELS